MNFYKTLEYITETRNKYDFLDEVGAAIGKFVSDKKLTGQENKKKTYAKNVKIKAAKNGFAYFTDGIAPDMGKNFYCCNASKFYKLYEQIEKESFGAYEPEQVEKTA